MTIEQLGSLGEFVAAIAVLISLVYVGLQVRQNTSELRRGAFRDVFQSYSAHRRQLYSDTELAQLIAKAKHSALDDISEDERLRLDAYYTEIVWITVQLWIMRETSALAFSDNSWLSTLRVFFDDHDGIVFRDYWRRTCEVFPEPFTVHFETHLSGRTL